MAFLNSLNTSNLGNPFFDILTSGEIVPGADPSYMMCKLIYEYHPLGKKLIDTPIKMAMFKPRHVVIPAGPEERLATAFNLEWERIGADGHIEDTMSVARRYGIGSVAMLVRGWESNRPMNLEALAKADISFNVFDPLNTSGSLVLSQNPNDLDFMKVQNIAVQGVPYHKSRTCTVLNEKPIYISYTSSAFGYVGRSVYQRALFPLKSFLQTMITDDMVSLKAGVLIAKVRRTGSVVDQAMSFFGAVKRSFVKEAVIGNVIQIEAPDEEIETLNLQNVNTAMETSRKNILENIASADDMPAMILKAETFAEGFGEGTEDAKYVSNYVDSKRKEMASLYNFFTPIVQYRAWNEDFYQSIQNLYPKEYGKMSHSEAMYRWRNSFAASWPTLLTEPESELAKKDDVLLKAVIAVLEVLIPECDPDNKGRLIQWAADNINELKRLFSTPMKLDYQAIADHVQDMQDQQQELQREKPAGPFSAHDSVPAINPRKLIGVLEDARTAAFKLAHRS